VDSTRIPFKQAKLSTAADLVDSNFFPLVSIEKHRSAFTGSPTFFG
jgi:hypothetical protein